MKVFFYGHFGTSNTGNESTLIAAVSNLRRSHPDWQLACACTNPEAVTERLGIPALPINSRSARIWNPQLGPLRRVAGALVALTAELRQWLTVYRALGGATMLVVPGTGLLTDAYGLSAWGPYNLFKWSCLARLRGCRVRFLSVGAGPVYSRRARRLARYALALADYRSYRDEPSLEWARRIGVHTNGDRICPDLAFSLPPDLLPTDLGAPKEKLVVGLGLMSYFGRYSAAEPNPETYPRYLDCMVEITEWLLEHDYEVRILLGDDDPVIGDFRSLLRSRSGARMDERVVDGPMRTFDEVLTQLAATDVVVATRFHNIVLGLLLTKPVAAISHHHKCASVVEEMGLSDYCQDIHAMDAKRLLDQFQKLESDRDNIRRGLAEKLQEFRAVLDDQYALVAQV